MTADKSNVDWTRTCWWRRFCDSGPRCMKPATHRMPERIANNSFMHFPWVACDEHKLDTDEPIGGVS
jgi:hypothetical protein